jgi:hypothetical protein
MPARSSRGAEITRWVVRFTRRQVKVTFALVDFTSLLVKITSCLVKITSFLVKFTILLLKLTIVLVKPTSRAGSWTDPARWVELDQGHCVLEQSAEPAAPVGVPEASVIAVPPTDPIFIPGFIGCFPLARLV